VGAPLVRAGDWSDDGRIPKDDTHRAGDYDSQERLTQGVNPGIIPTGYTNERTTMAAPTIKLPAELDRELTALAKERRSTRAKVLRDALTMLAQKENGKAGKKKVKGTLGERAADLIGSVTDAPADLSTNPKYMADFGR